MTKFTPEKIPTADYPHPIGTVVLGTGGLSTVVDRDGTTFLACCQEHEEAGMASGYYPQRENGRPLGLGHEAAGTEQDGYECPNTTVEDDELMACGEGMCHCRCIGNLHPCGCDCPRCPYCQQDPEDCDCDDA